MTARTFFIPYTLVFLILITISVSAHKRQKGEEANVQTKSVPAKPKLVVGIVIDQMRYDYLFRFGEDYSEDGFKRLLREGFLFENANYDYVPTYTAPGHACIYSGTTPSVNGIIANDWYDRQQGKSINCVGDTAAMPVGTTSISGKMSPKNLLSTTITDELRVASNFRSKVIGIALKDRGAILPAGHSANAAYWHDSYSNNWITSTYYMNELPGWVKAFNERKLADSLLANPWTPLLPMEAYDESTSDDTPYEGLFKNETRPVFPHDLPSISKLDEELIRRTPQGNTFTSLFAQAAIEGENLGRGEQTDFLALSFSSTDYVGHMYGTNAIEVQDTYVRFDRDLASFLNYLDSAIGKNNYLLFLTADHGAASNPVYNHDHNLPGEDFDADTMIRSLKTFLSAQYGDENFLSHTGARQIYLNRKLIDEKKINAKEMRDKCVRFVKNFRGVAEAASSDELQRDLRRDGIFSFFQKGYNDQRSADILIELNPGWIDWYSKTGTTHGSSYSYDTHVPLIFFGTSIVAGSSNAAVSIADIAPTIAALLSIESPTGTTGKQLKEVLK